MKMKFLLLVLSAVTTLSTADNPCANVSPQSNVDWTKLRGSWYHLLFYDGSGPTCRKMQISEVNVDDKFVNVEFYDLVRYMYSPQLIRNNFVFFRWITDPGLIFTGIRPGLRRTKFTPKYASKKKSLARRLSEIKISTYKVIATDYENYLIFMQCHVKEASIGISLKSLNVNTELQSQIHKKLNAVGVDCTGLRLNGTLNCFQ